MLSELRKNIRLMISESLESQRNIEEFTLNILREIGRLTLIYEPLTTNDGQKYLRHFSSLNTTGLPKNKYSKPFQNFIESSNLQIIFKKNMTGSFGKNSTTLGTFSSPNIIFLNLRDSFLEKINLELKENPKFDKIDMFTKMYYEFESTLIHEIQHAYDYWISKGKYVENKKMQHFQSKVHQHLRNNDEKISDDIIDPIFKKYTALPHEINARFTQAFKKIRKYTYSEDKKLIKKPYQDFQDMFEYEFEHWREMKPDIKRSLLKRLYLMWDKLPEEKTK